MTRLFIKIWPFTAKQICSKAKTNFAKVSSKFGQILDKLLGNNAKDFLNLPMWENFVKSGHTKL